MAQRYGSDFSPEGKSEGARPAPKSPFAGKNRSRMGGRVNLLFIAPLPMVWQAFRGDSLVMIFYLAAFGVMILAAWMTREGVKAQDAYDARNIAKRPVLPRKMIGSVLTGIGMATAGLAGLGTIEAIIFAVLGALLHITAFGADPLTDKGAEGVDPFQSDRVARAVDEAEKRLAAMSDAILRAEDRATTARVEQFQATVRDMFRTIEDDPRDLTPARKYLSVYLMGARDATIKFADLYARTGDTKAKADYTALLDDLETNFAAQTDKLLSDDRTDLEIEIEVLRDRLAREGVKPQL